jgi:hypothetical protein
LYLILRQQMSLFWMRNITTLHFEENCITTTASNSKISTERSWTPARYLMEMFPSPT